MPDDTFAAIAQGLAQELDCQCESWHTIAKVDRICLTVKGQMVLIIPKNAYKWCTPENFKLVVCFIGENLHVFIPPNGTVSSFILSDPNLIERLSKLISTYQRLTRIKNELHDLRVGHNYVLNQ